MDSGEQQQIGEFLQRYGWVFETQDAGRLIVTVFEGKSGTFTILMQVSSPFVIMAIVPFVPHPAAECEQRFYYAALRASYEMNSAKLGVDTDGDIVLSAELPLEGLTYEAFAVVLDALSFFADRYYVPLLNLSQVPEYEPIGDAVHWLPKPHDSSEDIDGRQN